MIISTDAEKHLTKPSIHLWKQTASNQDIEKNTLNLKRSIYQNKNLQLTSYLLVRDWMLSHKIGIKAMLFSLTTPQFSSVQFSRSVVSDSLQPHESQHTRPPCPSPTPRVHSDSCPSSQWCHPAISSSVVPFSSCPQSLPASESLSQLFAWHGQSTGVSALASFLPKKYQSWSPSQWTGWISLQSRRLSRVFSNTTVQKHIPLLRSKFQSR